MDKIDRRSKKLNLLLQCILILTMYLFIYSNLGSSGITGRYKYILGMIFSPFMIIIYLNNKKKLLKIIRIVLSWNFIILFILTLILIASNCINTTESFLESNPLKELVLNLFFDIIYLLFFLTILSKKDLKEKIYYLIKSYILCISLDNVFAILRYFNETFNEICLVIYPAENKIMEHYIFSKERLVGLGGFFFGGGIQNAISLLLIYFLLKSKKVKLKEKYILYTLFGFNFIVGILISRTTILGLFLVIIYGISIQKKKIFKGLKLLLFMLFFIILLYQFLSFLPSEVQYKINYFIFEQGEKSLKHLLEFYDVIPKEMKTILIGDLKWGNVNTGYYMGIDVGYLRYIFYGRIFFLIFMILFNYFLISDINDKYLKKLGRILFIFYLILMLKGYVTYLSISFLLYFITRYNKKGGNGVTLSN